VASVIMMYSPDIPSASPGNTTMSFTGHSRKTSRQSSTDAIENYYAKIETEESVKCVVSTLLFCFVLLAFFLVAILVNPEM